MNTPHTYTFTRLLMASLLGLFFVSCGEKKAEVTTTDRQAVLVNIGEKAVIPSFEAFLKATQTLENDVTAFTSSPSEASLAAARASWIETAKAWKSASVFVQGPVEDLFLAGAIDYTSVHYPNIEKAITDAATIDPTYVANKGSSLKGLKAIEYLLFGDGKTSTDILSTFVTPKGSSRKAYLNGLAVNVHTNAQRIIDAWSKDKENYLAKFTAASGREAGASLGTLVNKIISQLNTLKDERVGAPAGTRTNGEPQPDLAEAIPSGQSFTLLKSEIQGIERALTANNSTGIISLLDQLKATSNGEALSAKIATQFQSIYQKIDAFQTPLDKAVVTERENVIALYSDLKQLQVLLEVDLVNNLGILLTFSDSDGD